MRVCANKPVSFDLIYCNDFKHNFLGDLSHSKKWWQFHFIWDKMNLRIESLGVMTSFHWTVDQSDLSFCLNWFLRCFERCSYANTESKQFSVDHQFDVIRGPKCHSFWVIQMISKHMCCKLNIESFSFIKSHLTSNNCNMNYCHFVLANGWSWMPLIWRCTIEIDAYFTELLCWCRCWCQWIACNVNAHETL